MEEAASSCDANQTNLVVGRLVQHIVVQLREAFGKSVTTKFNCYFKDATSWHGWEGWNPKRC
eukprot:408335-Ditylum_brightwellii.AAC.1